MPTFFRIVKTDPPTVQDFLSLKDLGRPMRRGTSPERQRWAAGVSVFATTDAALRTAEQYPQLGDFLAMLETPDDGRIPYEQTGEDADHYTLWANAIDLLATVRSVVPRS